MPSLPQEANSPTTTVTDHGADECAFDHDPDESPQSVRRIEPPNAANDEQPVIRAFHQSREDRRADRDAGGEVVAPSPVVRFGRARSRGKKRHDSWTFAVNARVWITKCNESRASAAERMMSDRAEAEYSLTEPESGPAGKGSSPRTKRDAETVGESAGGFVGATGGMAIGAIGGPVGLVLAGLAGAVGGWWSGRGIADAITAADDDTYRRDFEAAADRPADRSYEDVRPAYVAGHLAGRNPDYAGRNFEQVESDLRCGWGTDIVRHCGEWPTVRRYARAGFDRARGIEPSEVDTD